MTALSSPVSLTPCDCDWDWELLADTKKKELVGNFKDGGREWQPKGEPDLVDVHDFPTDAIGKAIPYGVYDLAANDGFVSVGVDHDTPAFAATSIDAWWKQVGEPRYPDAREIFITADAGGSNGHRPRMWKAELQRLADKLDLAIHVSHFPPGTSKWNKVEHRLFSFISINWRGRPPANLRDHHQPDQQHHQPRRSRRPRAARSSPLSDRQEDLGQGIPLAEHRARRVPRRLELRSQAAQAAWLTSRLMHSQPFRLATFACR
jgi:hypothetical protein